MHKDYRAPKSLIQKDHQRTNQWILHTQAHLRTYLVQIGIKQRDTQTRKLWDIMNKKPRKLCDIMNHKPRKLCDIMQQKSIWALKTQNNINMGKEEEIYVMF